MILYHKSNLVYTIVFPQFLIFQPNNSAQTSMLIFFTSRHYYFFEKLKIMEKQLCKLNCSYGKVSHTLKAFRLIPIRKKETLTVIINYLSGELYQILRVFVPNNKYFLLKLWEMVKIRKIHVCPLFIFGKLRKKLLGR